MTRALIAFVPLLLAFQDTEAHAPFKLQDRVGADFNLFAEVDGVADFVEKAGAGPLGKFLAELRSTITKLAGKDPLKELPFDPLELSRKARGQLAFAGRYDPKGFQWVATVDFGDEAAAKEAAGKLAVAVRTGTVVWLASDKNLIDKTPDKPLGGSDRFKKARELSGAAAGRLFAFADLEPLVAQAKDVKDEAGRKLIEASGVAAVHGYATSLGFEKDAVTQRQVLMFDGKPKGLLGALAASANIDLDLKAVPARAVTATRHAPAAVKALADFLEEYLKGRAYPDRYEGYLRTLKAFGAGKEPVNSFVLNEADGDVSVYELDDAKGYQAYVIEVLAAVEVSEKHETVDGLDVTVLSSDTPGVEPIFKHVGASAADGRRCYVGPNAKALAAVHRLLSDGKVEPLAIGADLKGLGVVYVDWSAFASFLKTYLDAFAPLMQIPPGAAGVIDSVEGVMKTAGSGFDVVSVRDGAFVVESRSTAGLTPLSSMWVAAALVIPGISKATENAKVTRCGAQMSQLIMATYNHSVTKTPVEGSFLTGYAGHAFWKKIAEEEGIDAKLLKCPLTGRRYRGPVLDDMNQAPGDAAMGMCVHDDVANYVVKSGSVHRCQIGSATYERALRETVVNAGWTKAGAKWTYKAEDGKGPAMTIELKDVRDGAMTFERSTPGRTEALRETVVSRPDGLRITGRAIGGKEIDLPLTADEKAKVEAWIRDVAADEADRRDAATEGLTRLYARAKGMIDEALDKSADPEVQARLKIVRQGAVDHAPPAIAYPLKVGATWENAYGEAFEVLEAGVVETGIGQEPGWRINVKTGAETLELWWSDELNIPLALRPTAGGKPGQGWVLESASVP